MFNTGRTSTTATNYAAIFSPTNICPNICANGAKNDTSEYCRAEDADNLLEVDRLAGRGLVRFYMEAGNASMRMDVPEETARSVARWILDHTNA